MKQFRNGDRVSHIYHMSKIGTVVEVKLVPSKVVITAGPSGLKTIVTVQFNESNEVIDYPPNELMRAD
mgnify:CR=1 FL=1|jgi:hypothetical protein|tara:strand:- start:344 stop:547 length:204 start_codon:yes stop_codon:yes gene_type:complete